MIATIAKRFTFDAAHRLDRFPPTHKCHHMHGHTYEVELIFTGPVDPETGILIDYGDIAELWHPLYMQLDHKVLNDVRGLDTPSTEHVAGWIFTHIAMAARSHEELAQRELLQVVRVKESFSTWCAVWRADVEMSDIERFSKLTH